MNIEIISIGAELLSGRTVNTNASFIGEEVLKSGLMISRVTTVSDDEESLKSVLLESLRRADIVISTGGLGPTFDDVTRKVVCEIFGTSLQLDEELKKTLIKRFGHHQTIDDQATILRGADILDNPLGTAPGFFMAKGSYQLFVLPGVPAQMKTMFNNHVLPRLDKLSAGHKKIFTEQFYLSDMAESDMEPHLLGLPKEVSAGVCPAYGYLSVYLSSHNETLLKQVSKDFSATFGPQIYSTSDKRIEKAVQDLLLEKKLTISLAESCTGGLVSSKLTKLPGASRYLLSGVVSYSNEAKKNILGVNQTTLDSKGAVSQETVKEMALGVNKLSGSNLSLAISGIAGPTGGSKEKPVGTVWGAIAHDEKIVICEKKLFNHSRELMIERTANYFLGQLHHYLASL